MLKGEELDEWRVERGRETGSPRAAMFDCKT